MKYDLIVIGSGPAGQKAALQSAKLGKRVLVVEDYTAVGGGSVHFGTLPSKSFRESVYRWSLGSKGTLGQEVESHFKFNKNPLKWKKTLPDMLRLIQRRDRVVSVESQVIFDQFRRNQVSLCHGHARILKSNQVEVLNKKGNSTYEADFIMIATGSSPVAPAHIQVDSKRIHDCNTILTLKEVPKKLIVLGAGIIGCEYASMFSIAGSKVHLVDKRNEILANVDREIANHLLQRFQQQGMGIHLENEAVEVSVKRGTQVEVVLSSGEKIKADALLIALGRFGNINDLGLEKVGIKVLDRGLIEVDEHFRTSVSNIYAIGDVIGFPALASTSMEQGRIAACHAFRQNTSQGDLPPKMPTNYPMGIYTIPEISTIGITEEQARKQGFPFVIGRAPYREVARGQIVGDRWGLLKILVHKQSLKLLGVHIVGDSAADLIHIAQTVMHFEGNVHYFIENVFNYPTLAEAYKTAAFSAINQIQAKPIEVIHEPLKPAARPSK